MFRLIIIGILGILCLFSPINSARSDDLRDVSEASCRVSTGGAYGSGTAIHQDDQYIYVLTNAHVVGRQTSVRLEFFKLGRKTQPLVGQVVWKNQNNAYSLDFAIIRIEKSNFGDYPPNIIYFLPDNCDIKSGDYIVSSGCPRARWLSSWEGHIVQASDRNILFRPPPDDGQSGSSIFTKINGKLYVIAVVTYRSGEFQKDSNGFDTGYGVALRVSNFLNAYNGKTEFLKPDPDLKLWRFVNFSEELYARASDGNYYLQNPDGSVNVPNSALPIVEWNCRPRRGLVPLPGTPFNRNYGNPLPENYNSPNQPPTQNNPYGNLPPNIGIDSNQAIESENVKKLAELQKLYDELLIKYNELLKENESLKTLASDKDTIIADVNSKVENLTLIIQTEQEAKNSLLKEIETKNADINTKDEEIERLTKSSQELNVTVTNLLQQIEELKSQKQPPQEEVDPNKPIIVISPPKEDVENGKNDGPVINDDTTNTKDSENESIPSRFEDFLKNKLGVLWSAIIAIGGTALWMKYKPVRVAVEIFKKYKAAKSKVKEIKDAATQKYEDINNILQNHKKSIEEAAQQKISDVKNQVDSKLNGLSDFIVDKFGSISNNMTQKLGNLENKLDNIKNNSNNSSPQITTPNITTEVYIDNTDKGKPQVTTTKPSTPLKVDSEIEDLLNSSDSSPTPTPTPTKDQPVIEIEDAKQVDPPKECASNNVSSRVKQFFDLKMRDGESLEQWALFALLYKEAVQLLRQEKFVIKIGGKDTKLQGQQKTADAIDKWVSEQFLRRMSIEKLNLDYLYHEAMLGFLYKEAVERLRQGQFSVLGSRETANVIDNWVRLEFMRRMDIRLN